MTPKSDLYALGLVLFEMFTGKRAFEAGSRPRKELLRIQQQTTPPSLTGVAKDVDPATERPGVRSATAAAVASGGVRADAGT